MFKASGPATFAHCSDRPDSRAARPQTFRF